MHAYGQLVEDHPQSERDIREKHALGGDRVRVLWEAREGTAALRKLAQENVGLATFDQRVSIGRFK